MKTFETIDQYLKEFKPDDIIAFGGRGILDGLKNINSKHDTYKVSKLTTKEEIFLKAYRGRSILTLGANSYDQEIALLTKEEFKKLPILY